MPLQTLVLAIVVVFALFMWQGNKGFDLADEGFLWYGAQRVALGEVPIRDFMAYDPGRYYWSAALMGLWGDNGITTLRVAAALFQAMGLFVGLWLIACAIKRHHFSYLLLSTTTLVVWMVPYYRVFDHVLSILLIGTLAFLVQNPTSRRYFLSGLCIGLVAFFGRNHGMYGVAGGIGVMLWLSIKRAEGPGLIKGFALWAAGITAGFTPALFMTLLVPGFAAAFWESIRFLFETKATNIPLPIPWPWQTDFASVPLDVAIREVLVGLFFIATVVFGVLSVVWVVWQKLHNRQVSAVLVVSSFLALPYAYYAYSRTDIQHLTLGIFPLLVGCLVLLAAQPAKIKWPLALVLCTSSLWVMHVQHPGWRCRAGEQCVDIEIGRSNLVVDQSAANVLGSLGKMVGRYAPDGRSFVVTPFWPGAYSVFGRKSPMWEIYALVPRPQAFERAEIERIKAARPGFVLMFNHPPGGGDELRFEKTHPLTYHYILDHFERIHASGLYIAKGEHRIQQQGATP